MILAQVFAQLHDKNFRVTVPGFYDDVARLKPSERKAMQALPWSAEAFRKTVCAPGLCGEKGYSTLEQLWCRPTLELNGIWGGLYWPRRQDGDSIESAREILNSLGPKSRSPKNRFSR